MGGVPTVIRVVMNVSPEHKPDLEFALQDHFLRFVEYRSEEHTERGEMRPSARFSPSSPDQPYVHLWASSPQLLEDYFSWARQKFPTTYVFTLETEKKEIN